MGFLAMILGPLMRMLYQMIPNFAVTMIVFTVIIKLLMLPLMIKQQKSMAKMSVFTPMINEIQQKYKNNQEKMQEEMVKFQQEYGYSPTAGCLPMLVNMLVLFGMVEVVYRPVQYILGKDDTFPVKVEVDAPQQHPDAVGIWRSVTYTYADGCKIILEGEGFESKGKVPYIEGPNGKVYKGFECTIPNVMDVINSLPDPEPRNTDFLDCVKTRQKFALAEDNGHHSCTIVNMGACALRLGRTLNFDPDKQLFIDDDAANQLINQPMRAPWGSMIL